MNPFKDWLDKNDHILRRYAPDEIARMALTCGFELQEVCGPVADRTMRLKRMIEFWDNPLSELWVRAMVAQNGRDD